MKMLERLPGRLLSVPPTVSSLFAFPSKPTSVDGLSLSTYDFIMAPSTLFLLLKIVCCEIDSFVFLVVFDYLHFYVNFFFLHFEFV